ncbi:hypothetical protein ACS0TY_024735 [Phlomoides rotata]
MLTGVLYNDDLSTKANRIYEARIPFYRRAISTIVTKLPEAVNWLIYEINTQNDHSPTGLIIGLDVKIVPSGPAEGRVATLHLCAGSTCLVFKIHRALSLPPSLHRFFADPNNIFVGVDVRAKLDMLQKNYGIGGDARYEDLGTLAARKYERPELRRTELTELEIILIGEAVLKRPDVDPKWHYDKLPVEKVRSATVDVFLSMEFGNLLMKPLVTKKWEYGEKGAIEQFSYVKIFKRYILTIVTKHPVAVEKWVDDVMHDGCTHRHVGFDLELFFINKQQRIGTVQFCAGGRCLIIRFYMMNGRQLPNLERFLLHGNNTFVGIGIVPKMGMLLQMLRYTDGGRLRGIDCGKLAAIRYGWPLLNYAGHVTLIRLLLKTRLKMPDRLETDWYRRYKLSYSQVLYACVDAAVPFEIARRLRLPHF